MIGNFRVPCVDHLIEGVHYEEVHWNFSTGQPCPPGTKMIWGLCRRVNTSGEQQVGEDTDEEVRLKQEASKQGSAVETNKPVTLGGKKFGWAVKGGKPILVSWGSVAGTSPAGKNKAPRSSK